MQLTALSLALTRAGFLSAFSPASLFAANEPGVFFDPSDIDRYMTPLGPELVTNGDFSDGLTGWIAAGGDGASISSAKLRLSLTAGGGSFSGGRYQDIAVTANKWHKITCDIDTTVSSGLVAVLAYNGAALSNLLAEQAQNSVGANSFTVYVFPTSTTIRVYARVLANAGTTTTAFFDNIFVRELTAIDTATLFQDAAGTTPVTAVEQPVGLMLDKSRGLVLGPELVTNGDFSDGTTGWLANLGIINVSEGELFSSERAVTQFPINTVPGRWYKCTGQMRKGVGAGPSSVAVRATTSSDGSATGLLFQQLSGDIGVNFPVSFYFSATTTSTYIALIGNGEGYFDNISVRELPGNHATQVTATSRPLLSARYNLLTKTEQFDDAYWSNQSTTVVANVITSPDGYLTADKLNETAVTSVHNVYSIMAIPANISTRISLSIKAAERTFALMGDGTDAITVNLTTGVAALAAGTSISNVTSTSQGDGWFRVSYTSTKPSATELYIYTSINGIHSSRVFPGTAGFGIYIWGASLVPANQSDLPYQRVNTATDYDTVGFPHYLKFDGVDDWLVTGTITPGTDKAQVFAGVRKLSDAAAAVIAETTADAVTDAGIVVVSAPIAGGENQFSWGAGAGAYVEAYRTYTSPDTKVISASLDSNSIPRVATRLNGSVVSASSAAGPGSISDFVNSPLYIGRRGGTSLPFNGHLYPLIVRFGPTLTTEQIEQTETYVNTKTGGY